MQTCGHRLVVEGSGSPESEQRRAGRRDVGLSLGARGSIRGAYSCGLLAFCSSSFTFTSLMWVLCSARPLTVYNLSFFFFCFFWSSEEKFRNTNESNYGNVWKKKDKCFQFLSATTDFTEWRIIVLLSRTLGLNSVVSLFDLCSVSMLISWTSWSFVD